MYKTGPAFLCTYLLMHSVRTFKNNMVKAKQCNTLSLTHTYYSTIVPV